MSNRQLRGDYFATRVDRMRQAIYTAAILGAALGACLTAAGFLIFG